MKLFHGSENGGLSKLERRQANNSDHLPEQETRNAIYLTTDFGFALLAGGRPRGNRNGVYQPEGATQNQLAFIRPEEFEPEKPVFIYEWDLDDLPEGSYEIFGHQVIVDLDELSAKPPSEHVARELLDYYEITNWPLRENEHTRENKFS